MIKEYNEIPLAEQHCETLKAALAEMAVGPTQAVAFSTINACSPDGVDASI